MNIIKSSKYSDFGNIRLHIYVAGYPTQGESILIIVSEIDKPLITIVTDCYVYSKYNHISSLLKSWGNPSIDFFIWTHPHEDHSLGIQNFFKTHDSKKQSHILMPTNFVNAANCSQYKEEATKAYLYISQNYSKKNKYHPVHYDQYLESQKFNLRLEKKTDKNEFYDLQIEILGPNPGDTIQNADKGYNNNKFSIVYKLSLNGIVVFMGGDMDKTSLKFIDNDHFKNISFVKIPHHGSKNIKGFLQKLGQNTAFYKYAATTVDKKNKLPVKEILDGYHSIMTEVDCTGPKNGLKASDKYGCIHIEYDVANAFPLNKKLYGNAYKHNP